MFIAIMIWALFAILIILNVADVVSTLFILEARGGSEKNLILAWLFKRFDPLFVMLAVKIFFIGPMAWLLYANPPRPVLVAILIVLCLWYCWVVWHNGSEIRGY